MHYDKAFSYQLEDHQWPTKLGIGALISLVPILNFALAGYTVAVIRNVAARTPAPLPHWEDFGRKFRDGLILTLAGLVYALPMLIVLAMPVGLLVASRAASSSNGLQDLSNALAGVGGMLLVVALLILILYTLVLSVIQTAVLVIFSRDGTFASCFRLREMADLIRLHARPFFTAWLAVILAGMAVGFILSLVGMLFGWIPCIGWLPSAILGLGSSMYLLTVQAHLFGQFGALALLAPPADLPASRAESEQNPGDLSS